MKSTIRWTAAALWIAASLVACGQAAPTPEPVEPTPAEPTATAVPAGWSEAGRSRLEDGMGTLHMAGFADAQHGIGVGYAGQVWHTENGGKSWLPGVNSSWCLFGLEMVDAQTAFTCGNKFHVRVSENGGSSWAAVQDWGAMEPDQCRHLSFVDGENGWAARPAELASTSDGGATWTSIPLDSVLKGTEFTPVIAAISRVSVESGFLLTNEGLLYRTGDGGKTWLMTAALAGTFGINPHHGLTPEMSPAVALRFTDAKNGVLAIRRTGSQDFPDGPEYSVVVGRTSDGGLTWQVDELADWKGKLTVFLSRDGKFLTLTDSIMANVIVLQYN